MQGFQPLTLIQIHWHLIERQSTSTFHHRSYKKLCLNTELDQSDALSACPVLSLRDTANVNLIWLIWAQLQNGLSALPGQRVSLPLIDVSSQFYLSLSASQTAKTWRSAGRKQGSWGKLTPCPRLELGLSFNSSLGWKRSGCRIRVFSPAAYSTSRPLIHKNEVGGDWARHTGDTAGRCCL